MANKVQILTNMTTRQKVIAAVVAIVVLVVIWQLIGLFRSKSTVPPVATTTSTTTPAAKPAMTSTASPGTTGTTTAANPVAAPASPQVITPQPAQLSQQAATVTPREAELIRLQEETQAKYVAALNELQMLKVARDIAEANQAIMTAKLATVASQKKIIDLLAPVPGGAGTPEGYAKNLVNPAATAAPQPVVQVQPLVSYTVISVSQLQYRWSAVLGYKGNLYNVYVGDILPSDGSKVISIDKSGVMLEKEGTKTKISMVPII